MTRLTILAFSGLLAAVWLVCRATPALAQRSDQGRRSAPAQAMTEEEKSAVLEQYAFEVPYLTGNGTLTFEELVQGGTPFVLFWWLADCPICHLQMPFVQQLQSYVERDQLALRVVGINVDTTPEECQEYLQDKDLTFELLFDRRARETDEPFQVQELGCPLIYVFGEDSELVEVYTGFRAGIVRTIFERLDLPLPKDLEE